jgi:hypothetical protein
MTLEARPNRSLELRTANSTTPVSFNQPPSGKPAEEGRAATDDYVALKGGGFQFGIVIGAGDGNVYFYDSTGTIDKPIKWP